jgi:hypothetical protein
VAILILLLVYFVPSALAVYMLPSEEADKVIALNIVTGWSVVGWFVALAAALGVL